MNSKRTIGIVFAVAGVVMLVFSNYIANQVEIGRGKIDRAQRQVDTGNSLFSLTPVTKQVGQGITGSAQKRINAGEEEVSEYAQLSRQLQIGGVVLLILGIGVVFLSRKKH